MRTRRNAVELLAPAFAETAGDLGLASARIDVRRRAADGGRARRTRLESDLERGVTGIGPHLHELRIEAGKRDLRAFGSQGEQRMAVLGLVLAEAEVLRERRGGSPLVLLDDVLSELDGERRQALARMVERGSQTVITATSVAALPIEPAQALSVTPGEVR